MNMVAYKTVREDYGSLRSDLRVIYSPGTGGEPGPWITVPGNGLYGARQEGDVVALTAGGLGPILLVLEVEEEVEADPAPPAGVGTWRRGRVTGAWRWADHPELAERWGLLLAGPGETVHVAAGRHGYAYYSGGTMHVAAEGYGYALSGGAVRVAAEGYGYAEKGGTVHHSAVKGTERQ